MTLVRPHRPSPMGRLNQARQRSRRQMQDRNFYGEPLSRIGTPSCTFPLANQMRIGFSGFFNDYSRNGMAAMMSASAAPKGAIQTAPWRAAMMLGCLAYSMHAAASENAGSASGATPSSSRLGGASSTSAREAELARPKRADFGQERASGDARHIADWAIHSGDNGGMPFLIVDKANARVFVFDAGGRLRGAAPALLGAARGDQSVPGIGEREMSLIRAHERTTPAGRFVAEQGRNLQGEDIVWVDYDSAVSLHRVRATNPLERRLERLASATPGDNRISYGCINVPVFFYETVVRAAFSGTKGIVYVLPETRPAREVFGSYDVEKPAARVIPVNRSETRTWRSRRKMRSARPRGVIAPS